jgi:hypothetical protein
MTQPMRISTARMPAILGSSSHAERGTVMAKGQVRSTKEKKKPKAEWNKKKKGGAVPVTSAVGQIHSTTGQKKV